MNVPKVKWIPHPYGENKNSYFFHSNPFGDQQLTAIQEEAVFTVIQLSHLEHYGVLRMIKLSKKEKNTKHSLILPLHFSAVQTGMKMSSTVIDRVF